MDGSDRTLKIVGLFAPPRSVEHQGWHVTPLIKRQELGAQMQSPAQPTGTLGRSCPLSAVFFLSLHFAVCKGQTMPTSQKLHIATMPLPLEKTHGDTWL